MSYFHKRKAEIVGRPGRKLRRDSSTVIEAFKQRAENDRGKREGFTAARRLARFFDKVRGANEGP